MPRRPVTRSLALLLTAVVTSTALAGCDDPLASRRLPVPEESIETWLFTIEDGALRDPSALDLARRIPGRVRTHESPDWDFELRRSEQGQIQFVPRNVVLGTSGSAGLQRVDDAFEELDVAPGGGYRTDAALPVEVSGVYAVRSRNDPRTRITCFRYMKMEVLEVDQEAGRVTFRFLGNPNCGRRTLVPGATGEEQDV